MPSDVLGRLVETHQNLVGEKNHQEPEGPLENQNRTPEDGPWCRDARIEEMIGGGPDGSRPGFQTGSKLEQWFSTSFFSQVTIQIYSTRTKPQAHFLPSQVHQISESFNLCLK